MISGDDEYFIHVKLDGGDAKEISSLNSNGTVKDLQLAIQEKTGVPICKQKLSFAEEILDNPYTSLSSYGISSDCVVQMSEVTREKLNIYVKKLDCKMESLEIYSDDTVANLKHQLNEQFHVDMTENEVFYKRQPLKDDTMTMNELEIKNYTAFTICAKESCDETDEGLVSPSLITKLKIENSYEDHLLSLAVKATCKITYMKTLGTGFLWSFSCSPTEKVSGLFTCHHVINRKDQFHIHFTDDPNPLEVHSSDVAYFFTKDDLDATFIVFNRSFLQKLHEKHFLSVAKDDVRVGQEICIVQYPGGEEISKSEGKVKEIRGIKLLHNASTLKGSSGSPVCNADFEVVGIHRAAGPESMKDGYCEYNWARNLQPIMDTISKEWLSFFPKMDV